MFKSLSIKTKLGVLVAIPVIAALVVTLIGTYYVNKISSNITESIYEEGYQSMSLILNADRDAYQAMDNVSAILVGQSKNNLTAALKDEMLKSYNENIGQTQDRIKGAIDNLSQNKSYWGSIKDEAQGMTVYEHYDAFTEAYTKWLELADKALNTYQVDMGYVEAFNGARDHINSIGELLDIGVQQAMAESIAEKNQMIITMAIIDAVVLVLIIVLSVFMIRSITSPLKKTVLMIQDMAKGRLGRRLNLEQKDEVGVMGETLDLFVDNLQKYVVGTMKKVSEGDLSFDMPVMDSQDEIGPALKTIIETLRALVKETEMLTAEAVAGKLSTRGNAEAFQGGYRDIVDGVNSTLDAVIGPLNVAANYVDRISKGDIPNKITDEYNGDFNDIKNNLNTCIDAVNALVADAVMLSEAAVEGRLSTRADAAKHGGDFRKIVEGVNQTLDSLINPLSITAGYIVKIGKGEIPEKITDEYKGDFDKIKEGINSCIDGLGGLVEGSTVLGKMAVNDFDSKVEGNYLGIFNEIAVSVNQVCDTISALSSGLIKLSEGNLEDLEMVRSIGKQSENDNLTPSILALLENIKALADETGMLSGAAVEGKLSTRGEAGKFKGEYAKVIEGINNTLDAVIEPINEASAVLQEMARGNLQTIMEGSYKGDHAAIKTAMNETIHNIRSYVGEISAVLA